jgi:hypothetical protein
MKPVILSVFCDNMNTETLELQGKVVAKYNPLQIPHVHLLAPNHPFGVDYFLNQWIPESDNKFDTVIVLDVDCIPLHDKAFEYMLIKANEGTLIGNIQRSNHIENNQHVFVAPSAMAFTYEMYKNMGSPSFMETARGDVAEELTYISESKGIPLEFFMPVRYDASPAECEFWPLADGMPVYGIGTTFAAKDGPEVFWHNFQIRFNQERFVQKCKSILE